MGTINVNSNFAGVFVPAPNLSDNKKIESEVANKQTSSTITASVEELANVVVAAQGTNSLGKPVSLHAAGHNSTLSNTDRSFVEVLESFGVFKAEYISMIMDQIEINDKLRELTNKIKAFLNEMAENMQESAAKKKIAAAVNQAMTAIAGSIISVASSANAVKSSARSTVRVNREIKAERIQLNDLSDKIKNHLKDPSPGISINSLKQQKAESLDSLKAAERNYDLKRMKADANKNMGIQGGQMVNQLGTMTSETARAEISRDELNISMAQKNTDHERDTERRITEELNKLLNILNDLRNTAPNHRA